MQMDFTDYLTERVEDIVANLRKTDGVYSRACSKRRELVERIDPLIMGGEDILLAERERQDFQKLFEEGFTMQAIEQQELYRQGYLDCVCLLKSLGVLA